MANIVSIADFKGRYSLSASEFGVETFDDFVEQEEYDLLIDLLGTELYNDFIANPGDARWLALLNGEDNYTDYYGYKKNWNGLKYLLIPYIFSTFTMFNDKKSVQSGTIRPKFANSDALREYELKTLAYKRWNEFVQRWAEAFNFLYTNNDTYVDFEIFFKQKFNKGIIVKTNIT